jgi:restriction endonuclease S subunit
MIKLKELVAIVTGVYSKLLLQGEIYYLQASDFDANQWKLKPGIKPTLPNKEGLAKHFLETGDVLLVAKGASHFAVMYEGSVRPAVASSTFLVLKNLELNRLDSAFLVWHLNHPTTQKMLESGARGTSISSISKKTLGEMEMNVPSLQQQQAVVKLSKLKQKETNLLKEIQILKHKIFNKKLMKIANNTTNSND